jgi:hypothetical protein
VQEEKEEEGEEEVEAPMRSAAKLLGAGAAAAGCCAVVVAAASTVSATAAETCAAPSAGTFEKTFSHDGGKTQTFKVPESVDELSVTALGGHGGQGDHTAKGGKGGMVTGTVVVAPGDCLEITVGGYGGGNGGSGYGHGGDHGNAPGLAGNSGSGGGGSTAVVLNGNVLLGAGGGGGAGGDGEKYHHWGGNGGDALRGGYAGAHGLKGGNGGCSNHCGSGSSRAGRHGDGISEASGSGTGGGGGGGIDGGAGGGGGHSGGPDALEYGGGGGGGAGDSEISNGVRNGHFGVNDGSCPTSHVPATCHGAVRMSWKLEPARVTAVGGDGQQAFVGEDFPQPLRAKVTDREGNPVANQEVKFTLPDTTPATGLFDPALPTQTEVVRTDKTGIATSRRIQAAGEPGMWSATATAATSSGAPALFTLRNLRIPSRTAVSAAVNPSLAGERVSFVAHVEGTTRRVWAFGNVDFYVDGQPFGKSAAISNNIARSESLPLPGGTHQVTVEYDGGDQWTPSEAAMTQKVEKAPSALTLSSNPNPSQNGDGVTLSAKLTPMDLDLTELATGDVVFSVDGAPVATAALDSQGVATTSAVPISGLGEHDVIAEYEGDASFLPVQGTFKQNVGPDATGTHVATDANPTVYGQALTATATVSGAGVTSPTGTVLFAADGDEFCEAELVAATATTSAASCGLEDALSPGQHTITADYAGATGFDPSTGTVTQQVATARTKTLLQPIVADPVFGEPVPLSARVNTELPGFGEPDGFVQFSVDGTNVGEPTVVSNGVATGPTLTALAAGPHVFKATYDGSTRYGPSEGTVGESVERAPTTLALSSTANPSLFGVPVAVTGAVGVPAPGSGPLSGAVQLIVDGEDLGAPIAIPAQGALSRSLGSPALGDHSVRGYYSGDVNHEPSSGSFTQVVNVKPPPAKRAKCKPKKAKKRAAAAAKKKCKKRKKRKRR